MDAWDSYICSAKKNRAVFLGAHRYKFHKAATRQKKAEIIVELIKLEPSHLDESWIRNEIINWLRRHDCIDFVEAAFMAQTGRNRPTEKQTYQTVRDHFLVKKIDQIIKLRKCSRETAFKILAGQQAERPNRLYPLWDENNLDHQLELVLKKAYRRHIRRQKVRALPIPYYGHDIYETTGTLIF